MSHRARPQRPQRVSTLVHYRWSTREEWDEAPIERLLERARRRGLIREFDTGRGRICWFEGAPCAALRALRRSVLAYLTPYGPEALR